VVLPIVDKLGALLDVDIISANIKHHPNVAFVLGRRNMTKFIRYRLLLKRQSDGFCLVFFAMNIGFCVNLSIK